MPNVFISKYQTVKVKRGVVLRDAMTVIQFRCECGTSHRANVNALRGGKIVVVCTCDVRYDIEVSGALPVQECN